MDTIFAIATAQGKAGVAIVRVSGPQAFDACQALCGDVPQRRVASIRSVKDRDGQTIDHALVLSFDACASFTGEDVVEFHCHGAPAILQAVLRRLSEIDGLRIAEAGEFTRRAFENGRMDLAQVEGLADLIEAETEAQRKQALRVLSGEFGRRAEVWRRSLIRAAALLEATIDFADEEVPEDVSGEVLALISEVSRDLTREIDGISVAERVRMGFEVAIVGAPNVGKSTLLNALSGREAAITSEYAGTTRDVIEVRMDLRGLPVTILDTAGIRETDDIVEKMGIARARERAEAADLRIFLVDGTPSELEPQDDDIVVRAKSDLNGNGDGFAVSGLTGAGVSELVDCIANVLVRRASNAGLATRERHRIAMSGANTALSSAVDHVRIGSTMYDLAAEELRSASRQLEMLVGCIGVDDVLDEVFSSFCLGK